MATPGAEGARHEFDGSGCRVHHRYPHRSGSGPDPPRGEADPDQPARRGVVGLERSVGRSAGSRHRGGCERRGDGDRARTGEPRRSRADQRLPGTLAGLRRHALPDDPSPECADLARRARGGGAPWCVWTRVARCVRDRRRGGLPDRAVRAPLALRRRLAHHRHRGRLRRRRRSLEVARAERGTGRAGAGNGRHARRRRSRGVRDQRQGVARRPRGFERSPGGTASCGRLHRPRPRSSRAGAASGPCCRPVATTRRMSACSRRPPQHGR